MSLGAAAASSAPFTTRHSLGAIEAARSWASSAAQVGTDARHAGGEVAQLLRDSPTFAPVIDAGSRSGVLASTTLYEQSSAMRRRGRCGDPINFIALATTNHPFI